MLLPSPRALARLLACCGLLSACASGPTGPVDETGTLATGDRTLATGEYVDSFPVRVKAGDWVRVELHSTDFDPYAILKPPTGAASENDDAVEGDTQNAQIIFHVEQAGQYEVLVTSREPGEDGAYTLRYEVSASELQPVLDPEQSATGPVEKAGTLETGDRTLTSGEFTDPYPVRLRAGQQLHIRLHSNAFDPYLILKPPSGASTENDDAATGDTDNAEIVFTADQGGQYAIIVTTYEPGESGAYTLTYEISGAGTAADKPSTGRAPVQSAPDSEAAGVKI